MKKESNKKYLKRYEQEDEGEIDQNKRGPFGRIIDGKLVGGNKYRYCYNCKINHNRYDSQKGFKKEKIHKKFGSTFWEEFIYSGIIVYHIYNKAIRPSKKGQFIYYFNGVNKKPHRKLTCNHKELITQCLFCRPISSNKNQLNGHQNYKPADQIMMIRDPQKCNAEIIVIIKGEPIIALIDSGAAPNVISGKLVQKLGISYIKKSRNYGTAQTNGTIEIIGQIPQLDVQLGEKIFNIGPIEIGKNLERLMIIGRETLLQYGMIIDFGKSLLKMTDEKGREIIIGIMKKPNERASQIQEITQQYNIGFTGNFEEIAKGPKTKIAQIFITKETTNQSLEEKYLHLDIKEGLVELSASSWQAACLAIRKKPDPTTEEVTWRIC